MYCIRTSCTWLLFLIRLAFYFLNHIEPLHLPCDYYIDAHTQSGFSIITCIYTHRCGMCQCLWISSLLFGGLNRWSGCCWWSVIDWMDWRYIPHSCSNCFAIPRNMPLNITDLVISISYILVQLCWCVNVYFLESADLAPYAYASSCTKLYHL